MIHCIWRMRLGILLEFFRYLMKRKFRSKWRDILSECNCTRTQNQLVRKWTLNHLAKLAKRKEDEFEDVGVTNFGFMEELSDVFRPWIYWEKCKAIKGLSVRSIELWGFLNSIKVQVFFKKYIKKKHLCHYNKDFCYFCKSNISVISLIVGSRNVIRLSRNIGLQKVR